MLISFILRYLEIFFVVFYLYFHSHQATGRSAPDWDIIMGYDFTVSNSARALPHCATLIREANERLSWLSTHYAPGGSQWTGDEEVRFVRAGKVAGIKSKRGDGEHFQEYGLSRKAYCCKIEGLGMDTLLTDVFASKEAPKLQKCARYGHMA